MELCYYESQIGNVGDDLNPYILNQLVPNLMELDDNRVAFFIGTILFDEFEGIKKIQDFHKKKKIIFGSGIRFINKPIKIDSTWDVRFLRGPISSLALCGNKDNYITDPAYLIRETPIYKNKPTEKKYKTSVMPHFLSLDKIDWEKFCNNNGVHFISPAGKDLEFISHEIAQSEVLITEAMHGAILADVFRVPWKRFKWFSHIYEREMVSEFKWSDWLFSMNLEHSIDLMPYNNNRIISLIESRVKLPILKKIRLSNLDKEFKKINNNYGYQLSDDSVLEGKMIELKNAIDLLSENT